MRWRNVYTIFSREVRDQLRDRRTLFMIFILPMLLYPILGIGALQFTQMFGQKQRKVIVIGAEFLPENPPLLSKDGKSFNPTYFDSPVESSRIEVIRQKAEGSWLDPKTREQATRSGDAEVVIVLPSDLKSQLEKIEAPQIGIDYVSADEGSQTTYLRIKEVLARWQKSIISKRLAQDKLPSSYTEPLTIKPVDVATEAQVSGLVWARLFPFLLVMMSLTGAFYPAVDLCAGEKERGTMETLLISPASRSEIVFGKFFTVLLASVMTALLNLASMGLTGLQLARQFGTMSASAAARGQTDVAVITAPTFLTGFWIVLLLIPLAVFFSAICLSLAVLAKSMKEGQYYMTPLYLVCLPLIFLTLLPGIELDLFYSIVPITGVSLLLRSLILNEYDVAARYFLPVLVPTIIYGAIALRWAVDQFQREDVLFREAERFDLRVWMRHLWRDKEPTPRPGEAILCFALMLSLAWFLMQYLAVAGLATATSSMALGHLAFILFPPVAMAFLLTSSPRRTLLLYWPEPRFLLLGIALAFTLNPLVNELHPVIERLFPMSPEMKAMTEKLLGGLSSNLPTMLLLFAVIPAISEEFAFRGFILSGLERGYRNRTAILLSAVLFGFMHVLLSLFQQLFNATLLGVVLGLLAIRSRSLLPGVVFHMLNNGLAVAVGAWISTKSGERFAPWLYRDPSHGLYHYGVVVVGLLVSSYLLVLLYRSRPAKRQWDSEFTASEPAFDGG